MLTETKTGYTVKQLADLAGVSIRTLHYYDEIGLLKPSSVGDNGYRYYEAEAVYRLQQILFFREMELGLLQIKEIMGQPEFDLMMTLVTHRQALQDKIARLQTLIHTIDQTLAHLTGEVDMSKKKLFEGFTEEEQERYAQEASEKYGAETVQASMQLWKSYGKEKQAAIMQEGKVIYQDMLAAIGQDATSAGVQAIVARWHQHLRYFYEPTPEILRGLGHHYNDDPAFHANFADLHPDLPAFLEQAITHYCDVQFPSA
ncbi:MAG: MerR family transcriptional regulator [Anaerolineae bacterium]|nr:MerR family transcriptional regulator [Anaerolineae bacterium]